MAVLAVLVITIEVSFAVFAVEDFFFVYIEVVAVDFIPDVSVSFHRFHRVFFL